MRNMLIARPLHAVVGRRVYSGISLEAIIERHVIRRLVPYGKFTIAAHIAQPSGRRARNNGYFNFCYATLEGAAMLEYKATRTTADSADYSLQPGEDSRTVIAVHH